MRCKYNHDGDCCNSGAEQYMSKCKTPCETIVPVTNGDRIRAMRDEELENLPDEWLGYPCVFPDGECDSEKKCRECWAEWLRQNVED